MQPYNFSLAHASLIHPRSPTHCLISHPHSSLPPSLFLSHPHSFSPTPILQVGELKDSVKLRDEFISVMSHELRTPVNAVMQLSKAITMGAGACGSGSLA